MPRPRFRPSLFLGLLATLVPAFASAQRVVAWGDNSLGQLNVPATLNGPIQISAGFAHTVALQSNGVPAAWGWNGYGQCYIPTSSTVNQVSAGYLHSLGLFGGQVWAVGNNEDGQCDVPSNATQGFRIAGGGFHTLILNSSGGITAYGNNNNGQCNVPAGLGAASDVAAGYVHSVALLTNGTVAAWGSNQDGQSTVPAGLSGVERIASGGFHNLALKWSGTVVAWGSNLSGECNVPTGLSALRISAGQYHSLAVRRDGTVAAWGGNGYGQCNVPAGLTGVLEVAAGERHSVAIVADAHCVLDQTEIFSGDSATGTVKLATPAGPGGTVVSLVSDDAYVTVPASVTVPAGATSATFPVYSDIFLGGERTATIRTDNGRETVPFALKIKSNAVAALLDRATIVGGSTTMVALSVTIDRAVATDTVLDLEPSGSELAPPATLTIPAGSTSAKVNVDTNPTSTASFRQIFVSYRGYRVTGYGILVTPLKASVSFDKAPLASGEAGNGLIYLSAPVRQALTLPLSSSNAALTVPASVTVKPGAKFATFPITTTPVSARQTVRVTSTLLGFPYFGNVQLLPTASLKTLTLPATAYGNGKIVGTVRLTIAAPAGGTTVTLVSSNASLTVPATVTVPAGQYAATFDAFSSDVATDSLPVVTATAGGVSASSGVTVKPLSVSGLTLSASTVAGGGTVTGTVTLNTAVAVDTVVTLTSADPVASVPATVTILAGGKTATFTVSTSAIASAKNVKITVVKHGSSVYRTLKVTP